MHVDLHHSNSKWLERHFAKRKNQRLILVENYDSRTVLNDSHVFYSSFLPVLQRQKHAAPVFCSSLSAVTRRDEPFVSSTDFFRDASVSFVPAEDWSKNCGKDG